MPARFSGQCPLEASRCRRARTPRPGPRVTGIRSLCHAPPPSHTRSPRPETGLSAAHPSTRLPLRATSRQDRMCLASHLSHSGADFSRVAFPVAIPSWQIARMAGQSFAAARRERATISASESRRFLCATCSRSQARSRSSATSRTWTSSGDVCAPKPAGSPEARPPSASARSTAAAVTPARASRPVRPPGCAPRYRTARTARKRRSPRRSAFRK
jgi:hypothetical protein